MSVTGVPQRLAVVIDDHRTEDDLITTVRVDVADRELVVALTGVLTAGAVGVERPPPGQLPAAEIPRDDDGTRVVAARQDDARPLPVEVRGAGQEPVDPVAVGVAPAGHGAARRLVVHGRERRPILSTKDGQELWPGQDVAARVAVVGA